MDNGSEKNLCRKVLMADYLTAEIESIDTLSMVVHAKNSYTVGVDNNPHYKEG